MTYASQIAGKLTDAAVSVGTDGGHIGDFVAWSLRSTSATPAEFDAVIASSGYDAFASPKHRTPVMPSDETVLVRALEASADVKGLVVRKFSENPPGFSVHAYGKPEDEHHRTLRLWLVGDKIQADREHPLATVAAKAVGKHRTTPRFQTEDIRTWLCDELRRMGRIKLRDSGGFWYVAPRHADRLRALETLVGSLPGSGELTLIPQFGSKGAYGFLQGQVRDELASHISKLHAEAKAWAEDAKERPEATIARRLERVAQLRIELGMFRDVLRMEADDLDTELSEVERLLSQEVGV